MAITVEETHDSREGSTGPQGTDELRYVIEGTADQGEAKAALADEAPYTYDGKVRQTRQVKPIRVDVANPDTSVWEGVAVYRRPEDSEPETGDSVFSFDTTGGRAHITQSLETVGAYAPAGKTAPNFHGAIGVTRHGVEGCDIPVPVYNWTERRYLPSAYVTFAYRRSVFYLTGCINQDDFREFESGEVLFRGARGSRRGDRDWEVTFLFAASPNMQDIELGDGVITNVDKDGWEYLWVLYEDVPDLDADTLVKRPRAAYVERVLHVGNFAKLGIGT